MSLEHICPHCKTRVSVAESKPGLTHCPKCNGEFQVPRIESEAEVSSFGSDRTAVMIYLAIVGTVALLLTGALVAIGVIIARAMGMTYPFS